MPQADREPVAIEVILDREDHRQRPDRQRQASHRHGSQQLPAPVLGNRFGMQGRQLVEELGYAGVSSRVDRRSYVFGSFGAMSLSSTASRERYSRRKAQLPAVTARSSAMEAFIMTGRLWSSSLFAQHLMATRSTDMPASAAKVACSSPAPRWRSVAATAAA